MVMGVILAAAYHPGLPSLPSHNTHNSLVTTTSASCQNLVLPANVTGFLEEAHADHGAGQLQRPIYYGRCGGSYFALATFVSPSLGKTDQPETFEEKEGGSWKDTGGSGGSVCHSSVPVEMTQVWGLCSK